MKDTELLENLAHDYRKLKEEIHKNIIGMDRVIDQLLYVIFGGGHAILVGVPGLAKTLLVNTLARVLDLSFNRIQFTPDLMPSDITGTEIFESGKFKFIKGPVFANVVLADEINRAPPKTQSALLESMQEYKVTVMGKTHNLPKPFHVIATQNPIEQEGTYPLPEAQLDRFMLFINVNYPSPEQEKKIVEFATSAKNIRIKKVLNGDSLLKYQNVIKKMPVADNVIEFAVKLASFSRDSSDKFISEYVMWGAGPRASIYLILTAKVKAAFEGRLTPVKDDIIEVALPVMRHRIILNFRGEAEGLTSDDVVKKLMEKL